MSPYDETALPQAFLTRMQEMLGDAYSDFIQSYEKERTYGLRVNTSKISPEVFEALVPFPVTRIPWTENGYFYPSSVKPSHCPLYQAGLYYLQEPSAMTPASRLPIEKGDFVLDLCAAPGGKATALGAALQGEGLLVANDISATRVKPLLRNLELFGIPNALLTNETPAHLAEIFPEFFDKILLDAPCSGEGMFRKEDALARDWTPEKSEELSQIQRQLCLLAADMLLPGGLLLYSTCTFAPCEDEGTIAYLLEQRPDLDLVDMEGYEGFTPGNPAWGNGDERLKKCIRIFPHRMDGEGHFLALLKKKGESPRRMSLPVRKAPNKETVKLLEAFFAEIGLKSLLGSPFRMDRVEVKGDKVYYLGPVPVPGRGLRFLRNGLFLGDLKKNRFEPSEPFALCLRKEDFTSRISLKADDPRLTRYLKGETLQIEPGETTTSKGWTLLCAEGYPIGFGKLVNGTLKNKYPAGWRIC